MEDYNDELLAVWQEDIQAFALDFFGTELRPKQLELADAFRNNQRITFRAGVGIGKSYAVAVLIYWGITCFKDIQISVLGPSEGQLEGGLWKEIEQLYPKVPKEFRDQLELNKSRLQRPGDHLALCLRKVANAQNTETLRGIHAPMNWVFVDEATGVADECFDVLQNIFSDPDPKMCLISNPKRNKGFFFETHENPDLAQDWVRLHGQATDNPTLTAEGLAALIRAKGGVNASNCRCDVFGEFPLSNADGVIDQQAVLEAVGAEDIIPAAGLLPIWGVDVAGGGKDRSVLVMRHDNTVTAIHEWPDLDTVQLSHAIKALFDKAPAREKPGAIAVDAIGIGAGVFDQLVAMGLPARKIVVSRTPVKKPDDFHRLRDEVWWSAREWFSSGAKSIPNHPGLIKELCLPSYEYVGQKVKVEDKRSIRKRGRASPDVADAFCLTLAVHPVRRDAHNAASAFKRAPRRHLG